MVSSILRRGWFSWAAPARGVDTGIPSVLTCTASGTSVVITFDEAMRASPAAAQFTATVNGVARGVNAAAVAGAVLTLTLASAVSAGQAVVVSYAPGATQSARLADNARGNEVSAASPLASATAT
jgi:uncharacterized repeat protein (TIGR02059 family)